MRRLRLLVAAVVVAAAAVGAANAAVLAGGRDGAIVEPADCVLVLGAGVRPDGSPSDVLRDRLDEALDAWRAGAAPRLLVSGDHGAASYDETNAMRTYLEARGVPREAVFMDHAGFDTYSSMWRAKHVFGARRVVVVTQRFHLPRALWTARALGLEAEGRAADRRSYRGVVWLELREIGSRAKALLDVESARTPRHAGPKIRLDGDARATAG